MFGNLGEKKEKTTMQLRERMNDAVEKCSRQTARLILLFHDVHESNPIFFTAVGARLGRSLMMARCTLAHEKHTKAANDPPATKEIQFGDNSWQSQQRRLC